MLTMVMCNCNQSDLYAKTNVKASPSNINNDMKIMFSKQMSQMTNWFIAHIGQVNHITFSGSFHLGTQEPRPICLLDSPARTAASVERHEKRCKR